MPTYKGNDGNLMQHWTLCELVNIAVDNGAPGLHFIDAHAMAPLARQKEHSDGRFNRAEFRVQRDHSPDHKWASKYEWAWHHLAPSVGYPNSAVFVEKVWESTLSLLLCETDGPTIAELELWRDRICNSERCAKVTVAPGDWRNTFVTGLPNPAEVGLLPGSLTLLSFDPYYISRHGRPNPPGPNIYAEDLRCVRNQLNDVDGRIVIQFSTYTPQNNPLKKIMDMADGILTLGPDGFTREARTRVGDRMMSLVYTRGLDDGWHRKLQGLPDCFQTWLCGI